MIRIYQEDLKLLTFSKQQVSIYYGVLKVG